MIYNVPVRSGLLCEIENCKFLVLLVLDLDFFFCEDELLFLERVNFALDPFFNLCVNLFLFIFAIFAGLPFLPFVSIRTYILMYYFFIIYFHIRNFITRYGKLKQII